MSVCAERRSPQDALFHSIAIEDVNRVKYVIDLVSKEDLNSVPKDNKFRELSRTPLMAAAEKTSGATTCVMGSLAGQSSCSSRRRNPEPAPV